MRAALLVLLVEAVAVAAVPPAAGERSVKPSLRLASLAPLTLRGTGFVPRERVRIEVSGTAAARRRTLALASGSFTVRFDGVALTRCDFVRVVAVGSRGSRAVLKHLPSPACIPA